MEAVLSDSDKAAASKGLPEKSICILRLPAEDKEGRAGIRQTPHND